MSFKNVTIRDPKRFHLKANDTAHNINYLHYLYIVLPIVVNRTNITSPMLPFNFCRIWAYDRYVITIFNILKMSAVKKHIKVLFYGTRKFRKIITYKKLF